MGDMGDFWNDVNSAGQKKRGANRDAAPDILTEAGIAFESKNYGAHLVVTRGEVIFDFWPGTGKYIERGTGRRKGRGVFNLIRILERIAA